MLTGPATTTIVDDRQRSLRAAAHDQHLAGRPRPRAGIRSARVRAGRILVQTGLRLASARSTGPVVDVTVRSTGGRLLALESCRSAAVLSRVRC